MFGYVLPDKPYLYMKDDTLYNALYCGVCKSIGKELGQIPRFTLSYDMAFMSCLAHNICNKDVKIEKKHCIAHTIKKRPIAEPDDISKMLANLNLILAYYKLKDDKLDENKGGFKSSLFKKGYKKAKKNYSEFDKIVKNCYEELVKLEKENCESVDIVSDCFANMLSQSSVVVFKEYSTEYTKGLLYGIGKWIYLIDALDDYDKDVYNKNYNVFYNAYKSKDFKTLILEHENDVAFIFNTVFMQIIENFKNVKTYYYNTDLVTNIITRGIPAKTNEVIKKAKQINNKK